jgi:hypothetical protein
MYVSKFQPSYRRSMTPTAPGIKYAVSDVWAAACAAQRVNGAYIKESEVKVDSAGNVINAVQRNRDIMMGLLENPANITVDDVVAGELVLNELKKDLTWRALKGKLNDFDQSASKVLAVEDHFDSQLNRLELAVVACLPASYERMKSRQSTEDRMSQTSGEYVAPVGHKAMINVSVVGCNYSTNWNTYYITAVTQDNQAVFFSIRESYDAGTHLTIRGTVKAHKDGSTQLNRVSIL